MLRFRNSHRSGVKVSANDARQRRAVARGVVLAVPPPGGPVCGPPVARSRAGTDIRPTHGVHPLRNHRSRRAAELAREQPARETLTGVQWR
jgi:hypothetical protein